MGQKYLGILAVFILFFSLGFIAADLAILNPSINFSSGSNFYNISLNNTAINAINLTQINITFPSTFNLTAVTNGTDNSSDYTLIFIGQTLFYSNSTSIPLMLNNSKQYFWINATASAPGTYYINITALDDLGRINRSSVTVIISGVTRATSDLINSSNFTILAKTAITDANPSVSYINGNVGLSPAAGSFITGMSCTKVNGSIYEVNVGYTGGYDSNTTCAAGAADNKTYVDGAILNMVAAYNDIRGRTLPDATELGSGEIGGLTLYPGLYKWGTAVTISNDVTLDCRGNASEVFIFQISSTLTVSSNKKVVLSGGCLASNIFWQADTAVTLGTTSIFEGTILAGTAITINTGAQLNGRAFAQTAVTLDGNYVTLPLSAIVADILPPVVIINSPVVFANQSSKTIDFNISSIDININYTSIKLYNLSEVIINSTTNTTSGVILFSLTVLAEGNYNINVTAYDLFGNVNSVIRNITIDSTGPLISAFSSPSSANSYTNSTGIISLNLSITDVGVGISSVKFNITNLTDSQLLILGTNNAGGYYWNTTGLNLSGWTDGVYKIKLLANDSLNNNATNLEIGNITLDRTAPSRLNFTLLFIERTALVFSVNITDSTSGVSTSCAVNDGTVVGIGTSQNISQSSLTCGSTYTYVVNCSDSAGNTNSTSVSYTTSACGVSRGSGSGSGSLSSGSSTTSVVNASVSTPVTTATPTTEAPTTGETPATPVIPEVTSKSNLTRNILIVVGILAILGILGYVLMRKKR